jgi:uncharacterized integral membrane protein
MTDQAPGAGGTGAQTSPGKRAGAPWRLILFGALAVYGVLLAILNADSTKVSFVFWETQASLVVLLLLALGIGFLAGFLFDTLRSRRKRSAS